MLPQKERKSCYRGDFGDGLRIATPSGKLSPASSGARTPGTSESTSAPSPGVFLLAGSGGPASFFQKNSMSQDGGQSFSDICGLPLDNEGNITKNVPKFNDAVSGLIGGTGDADGSSPKYQEATNYRQDSTSCLSPRHAVCGSRAPEPTQFSSTQHFFSHTNFLRESQSTAGIYATYQQCDGFTREYPAKGYSNEYEAFNKRVDGGFEDHSTASTSVRLPNCSDRMSRGSAEHENSKHQNLQDTHDLVESGMPDLKVQTGVPLHINCKMTSAPEDSNSSHCSSQERAASSSDSSHNAVRQSYASTESHRESTNGASGHRQRDPRSLKTPNGAAFLNSATTNKGGFSNGKFSGSTGILGVAGGRRTPSRFGLNPSSFQSPSSTTFYGSSDDNRAQIALRQLLDCFANSQSIGSDIEFKHSGQQHKQGEQQDRQDRQQCQPNSAGVSSPPVSEAAHVPGGATHVGDRSSHNGESSSNDDVPSHLPAGPLFALGTSLQSLQNRLPSYENGSRLSLTAIVERSAKPGYHLGLPTIQLQQASQESLTSFGRGGACTAPASSVDKDEATEALLRNLIDSLSNDGGTGAELMLRTIAPEASTAIAGTPVTEADAHRFVNGVSARKDEHKAGQFNWKEIDSSASQPSWTSQNARGTPESLAGARQFPTESHNVPVECTSKVAVPEQQSRSISNDLMSSSNSRYAPHSAPHTLRARPSRPMESLQAHNVPAQNPNIGTSFAVSPSSYHRETPVSATRNGNHSGDSNQMTTDALLAQILRNEHASYASPPGSTAVFPYQNVFSDINRRAYELTRPPAWPQYGSNVDDLSRSTVPTALSTFSQGISSGDDGLNQPRRLYSDDRDRMVYVSWIPKRARAYCAADKRKMELDLKRRLREDLGLIGLTKVLLFPPKGVHCKLIFENRTYAGRFMEMYGGENHARETERWKYDICRILKVDMHDKFETTVVKIEWSQK